MSKQRAQMVSKSGTSAQVCHEHPGTFRPASKLLNGRWARASYLEPASVVERLLGTRGEVVVAYRCAG
eukprot:9491081-Pyramimonas_sp.AAC.1